MKVRAIHDGFYDGQRRRAGDVFEFGGEKLGKWMVPADAKAVITDEAKEGPPAGTAEAVKAAAKQKAGRKPKAEQTDEAKEGPAKSTGDQDVI